MKLFLDQNIYLATIKFCEDYGHDIVSASDLGLARAGDADLLRIAQEQGRILLTRDRDFGNLVFIHRLGAGVLYLRMSPANLAEVHLELARVWQLYSGDELQKAFVVIGPSGHRFRNIG